MFCVCIEGSLHVACRLCVVYIYIECDVVHCSLHSIMPVLHPSPPSHLAWGSQHVTNSDSWQKTVVANWVHGKWQRLKLYVACVCLCTHIMWLPPPSSTTHLHVCGAAVPLECYVWRTSYIIILWEFVVPAAKVQILMCRFLIYSAMSNWHSVNIVWVYSITSIESICVLLVSESSSTHFGKRNTIRRYTKVDWGAPHADLKD